MKVPSGLRDRLTTTHDKSGTETETSMRRKSRETSSRPSRRLWSPRWITFSAPVSVWTRLTSTIDQREKVFCLKQKFRVKRLDMLKNCQGVIVSTNLEVLPISFLFLNSRSYSLILMIEFLWVMLSSWTRFT